MKAFAQELMHSIYSIVTSPWL